MANAAEGERWRDRALASTEVGDIWGIGRQYAQKLNCNGIMTALDLTSRPDGWIRKEMGVGGLKTVRELRGEDCIGFDDMPQPCGSTPIRPGSPPYWAPRSMTSL